MKHHPLYISRRILTPTDWVGVALSVIIPLTAIALAICAIAGWLPKP